MILDTFFTADDLSNSEEPTETKYDTLENIDFVDSDDEVLMDKNEDDEVQMLEPETAAENKIEPENKDGDPTSCEEKPAQNEIKSEQIRWAWDDLEEQERLEKQK